MRRKLLWLPLLLLLAASLWRAAEDPVVRSETADEKSQADESSGVTGGPSAVARNAGAEASLSVATDPNVRQAFRFQIDAGKVTLTQVEDLNGKFKARRGEPDRMPGMFCYRLLDKGGRLLAEETQPAPDHQCVVLDPNLKGPAGEPVAASLTPSGPLVFMIRMPKHPQAETLKVYRLSGAIRPLPDREPAGELLASVAVPR